MLSPSHPKFKDLTLQENKSSKELLAFLNKKMEHNHGWRNFLTKIVTQIIVLNVEILL